MAAIAAPLLWGEWLAPAPDAPSVRCPRCQHRGAAAWLPSRSHPDLWWSRCERCTGIAIWRSGQLDQPCGEEVLPRDVRRELAVRLIEQAATAQRDVIDVLSETRAKLMTEEGYLGEVTRFLVAFTRYSHDLRRGSPVADVLPRGPVPVREDQSPMSDDRVLQAAQNDESATQRRIEELREEIERAEARLQDISDFIAKYREYENVAQPVTSAY